MRSWACRPNVFSVQPLRPLCLCGENDATKTHHRDTEDAEVGLHRELRTTRYRVTVLTVIHCEPADVHNLVSILRTRLRS